jgi:DNA-binding winged helix-turn-helix (wHTH) protein
MRSTVSQSKQRFYYFANFHLDTTERGLWRADKLIALKPKQFDLLLYFIENAGRVIKRDELLDAVWTDTYIEENTLTRNISWLRKLLEDGANGENIIETVPKRGYRFAVQVIQSDEPTRFDIEEVIIEEQIIQHLRGEEIITIDGIVGATYQPDETAVDERKIANPLLQNNLPPNRLLPVSSFLLIGVAILGFLAVGFAFYKTYFKTEPAQRMTVGISRTDTDLEVQPANVVKASADEDYQFVKSELVESEKKRMTIGSVVRLRNATSDEAVYLDVWGQVKNKPEFSIVPTETMFVSTHSNPNRENGSGSWRIVSATGKKDGEILLYGDKIHLQSLYPDAGYLDNCGWLKHMPVYKNYMRTGKFAVFTTYSEDRDNGTGTWIVSSDIKFEGNSVLEEDEIALENGFPGGGFLNAAGLVSDIPAFGDYDGRFLVFISASSTSRRPGSGIWVISGN